MMAPESQKRDSGAKRLLLSEEISYLFVFESVEWLTLLCVLLQYPFLFCIPLFAVIISVETEIIRKTVVSLLFCPCYVDCFALFM